MNGSGSGLNMQNARRSFKTFLICSACLLPITHQAYAYDNYDNNSTIRGQTRTQQYVRYRHNYQRTIYHSITRRHIRVSPQEAVTPLETPLSANTQPQEKTPPSYKRYTPQSPSAIEQQASADIVTPTQTSQPKQPILSDNIPQPSPVNASPQITPTPPPYSASIDEHSIPVHETLASATVTTPTPEQLNALTPAAGNSEPLTITQPQRIPVNPEQYAPNATPPSEPTPVASFAPIPDKKKPFPVIGGLNTYASTGIRIDSFDWNIASEITGTQTPNVLSELTWKNVMQYQVKVGGDYTLPYTPLKGLYVEGSAAVATAFAGDTQDSDYLGDNRTEEFSRSHSDSSNSDASSKRIAAGYSLNLSSTDPTNVKYIFLTPVVGYAQEEQSFSMTDGTQEIPETAPILGLNSHYDTKWKAPFIGARLALGNPNNRLSTKLDYHRGTYEATADWNLRDTLMHPVSYTHHADAQGWNFSLTYEHNIFYGLSLFANADLQYWNAEDGLDRLFFSNGTSSDQKLNDVNWRMQYYALGLNYRW